MSPSDQAIAKISRVRFAAAVADDRGRQEAAAMSRATVRESARDAAARGVSIAELARIAGVTRHTIYSWLET